jgi:hypothetical protein
VFRGALPVFEKTRSSPLRNLFSAISTAASQQKPPEALLGSQNLPKSLIRAQSSFFRSPRDLSIWIFPFITWHFAFSL